MKRITTVLLIGLLFSFTNSKAQTAYTGIRGITALEATAEMAPGINLYNTLDAVGNWVSGLATETMWGNPYTTPEMIQSMADRGFKTLRIPVTWHNHMKPAPDYIIDTAWMDRVEEVANYAFDNNMYVIINIHHDDEQFTPTYAKQTESTAWVENVWTQIATRFKDYGDYLIFETLNEPREVGSPEEWTGGSAEHREVVNALNLAAVNVIRGSGGNNDERFIMVPQVGANTGPAVTDLIIPNNDTNIIVSVHSYDPYWFCLDGNGSGTWGSPADIASLETNLLTLGKHFSDLGQAVVMGEWGAGDKDNYADRVNHYSVYTNSCKEGGITPIVWMYGFDREELVWNSPLIEEAILQVYDTNAVVAEDITLNIITDSLYVNDTLQLIANIKPDTVTITDVAWTSARKGVATISSTGLIRATGGGTTTIKAATIGQVTECKIVVIDTVERVDFIVQAEAFSEQSGTQTESCSDEGGGQGIGFIENNDWCTYSIKVDSAGIYDFSARAATETVGGSIELSANGKVLGTLPVDGGMSDGWQDWFTTEYVEIDLPEGTTNLKLTFKAGSGFLFNLNWYRFNYNRPSDNTSLIRTSNEPVIKVYPNPASDVLNLELSEEPSKIQLYSLDGRRLMQLDTTEKMQQIDLQSYQAGTYILQVTFTNDQVSKKIVIK